MLSYTRFSAMVHTAIRSLQMHKLRSLLTVLGLVFGVASVIVMLAVAEGANRETQRQIESLGVKNVIVRSVKPSSSSSNLNFDNFENSYGLTYNDLRRIEDAIPTAVSATPLREFTNKARFTDVEVDARIVGVYPNYFITNGLAVSRGRAIESNDLRTHANVCVIGYDLARKLFRHRNPIGRSIQVSNANFFRVVGVTEFRNPSAGIGSSLSAQDYNLDVYIPLTTDRARHGDVILKIEQGSFSQTRLELSQITVQVDDRNSVKQTAAALEGLIGKFHPKQDYSITIPLDLLEQAQATQRIFNIVLGATAAISLLVGGIGIMNIMLASVSERTQEIGIRRALGARQADIVLQFLIETATLSVIGTAIGVAIGLLTPRFVTWISGMETQITAWSIVVAAAVSLTVGIVFGLYPARRAARLDPIEALRRV
ncbi:MAG: ABC transporter permease [Pirellulaceae bacterium]